MNEKFTQELYNRCLLIPYAKYEKLAYKQQIIELYEKNALVSINHKYKTNITEDTIAAYKGELLSSNFNIHTVTYIAVLKKSSLIPRLSKLLLSEVAAGDVIIGVADPFEYLAHLYLYAHMYTTVGTKIEPTIKTTLQLFRIITVQKDVSSIPKTFTTSLTIEYDPNHSKLILLAYSKTTNNKIKQIKLAKVAKLNELINVYLPNGRYGHDIKVK